MDLQKFWHLVPDKDALKHLSRQASEGIFRLMVISVFADQEVTSEERVALSQAIVKLPFFEDAGWRKFDTMEGIQILAGLFDRFKDEEDFPVLMGEIAAALPDKADRVLGLHMVARLLQTNSFTQDEFDFCLMLGQALGLDQEEVGVLIEDAVDYVAS